MPEERRMASPMESTYIWWQGQDRHIKGVACKQNNDLSLSDETHVAAKYQKSSIAPSTTTPCKHLKFSPSVFGTSLPACPIHKTDDLRTPTPLQPKHPVQICKDIDWNKMKWRNFSIINLTPDPTVPNPHSIF